MTVSNFKVFFIAFVAFFALAILFRKHRNAQKDVIVYTIGNKDYLIDSDEEQNFKGLLHRAQILKRSEDDDELTVVEVPFPNNDQDFVVMLVQVLNYNSMYTNEDLAKGDMDDDNFWVLISEGAIETNHVTVELNSYMDIDADVEFYGYRIGDPNSKDL